MNLLFLCSQNKRRSLTAEKLFDGRNGHQARSTGTEKNARVKVTPGLLGWADIIFCMEKKHVRRLKEKYPDIIAGKKLICLYIDDDYEFMDRELQELLENEEDKAALEMLLALTENEFSREELQDDLKHILSRYALGSIAEAFLS